MFALLKLILNIFSAVTTPSLIPSVGPSPNAKKLFFGLSILWGDELLSTPKIITFLTLPLSKFQTFFLSNVIPGPS